MIQPKGKKEKKIMDGKDLADYWASLVVQDPPAIQETQIQFPGSGRSPGEGNDCPFQYSCLKNSMDRGAWQATVHGVVSVLDTTEHLTL